MSTATLTDAFTDRWAGSYPGATGWLVGKGPSVRHLTRAMIDPGGPVMVLNAALGLVEPLGLPDLFALQKDAKAVQRPQYAVLLLHRGQSEPCVPDYSPRYVFDARVYGCDPNDISAPIGVLMLRTMGCARVVLVGFDACTNGDLDVVAGVATSRCYLDHCRRIREVIDETVSWMEPQPDGTARWFSHDLQPLEAAP